MNENLGIAAELAAKRQAMVSRLSPAAQHQRFPNQYARPLPAPNTAEQLRVQLRKTQGQLDESRAEVVRLQTLLKKAHRELEEYTTAATRQHLIPIAKTATVANVLRQFLAEYNALALAEKRPPIELADLTGPRRSRTVAWPRQVAMWLCKHLAKGASLPMVGKAFGGKDHTTVLHACKVAELRFLQRPDLNIVAIRVMAHFEAAPALKAA